MDTAATLAASFARAFRLHVVDEAMVRIRRCVELLDEEEVWKRHGRSGNSIGNLVLHLEGNVRQWILCGIRGDDDSRDRDAEFAAAGDPASPRELTDRLAGTVAEAATIVDGLTPEVLIASRTFQGRFEREVAGAVLHVLEHFCGHAYQIYAWTKEAKDVDLAFWEL